MHIGIHSTLLLKCPFTVHLKFQRGPAGHYFEIFIAEAYGSMILIILSSM